MVLITNSSSAIIQKGGDDGGNPFYFLQLKTGYIPTGLEPVGTIYRENGFRGVAPDGIHKEFATKEYVDDTAFISSLLFG